MEIGQSDYGGRLYWSIQRWTLLLSGWYPCISICFSSRTHQLLGFRIIPQSPTDQRTRNPKCAIVKSNKVWPIFHSIQKPDITALQIRRTRPMVYSLITNASLIRPCIWPPVKTISMQFLQLDKKLNTPFRGHCDSAVPLGIAPTITTYNNPLLWGRSCGSSYWRLIDDYTSASHNWFTIMIHQQYPNIDRRSPNRPSLCWVIRRMHKEYSIPMVSPWGHAKHIIFNLARGAAHSKSIYIRLTSWDISSGLHLIISVEDKDIWVLTAFRGPGETFFGARVLRIGCCSQRLDYVPDAAIPRLYIHMHIYERAKSLTRYKGSRFYIRGYE